MKGSRIAIILAVVSMAVVGTILLNDIYASNSSVTVNDNTVESDYFTMDIVDMEGNVITDPLYVDTIDFSTYMSGTTYCTTDVMKIRTDWSNDDIDNVDCCAVLDITYPMVWYIIDHIEFDVYVPVPHDYDGTKYVEDGNHDLIPLEEEVDESTTVYKKETRDFGKITQQGVSQSGVFSPFVQIPKGDCPFTITIHFTNSEGFHNKMFNSLVNELAGSKLTIMANENNPIGSS